MANKEAKSVSTAMATAVDGELLPVSDKEDHSLNPIAIALKRFLTAMDDYRDAVNIAMPAIVRKRSEEIKRAHDRIDKFLAKVDGDGIKVLEAKSAHDVREMSDAIECADRLADSKIVEIVIKSLFVGMFSEYDSFIGDLLKAIYRIKPDLYKGIKREISLSDLLGFENIEEIKRDILEKEIDTFRRDSYIEQFAVLEQKFNIKTLRAFDEWPVFVEMGQRRNLMTHNDGMVSQQYIQVCTKEGVKFEDKPTIGYKFDLPVEYIGNVMLVISKVGFMLAHTLWRKIAPDQIHLSHGAMNRSIYSLLEQKRWTVAAAFGEFALTDPMRREIREVDLKIRIINHAISLKKLNRKDDVAKLIQSVDWSASIREFALAIMVLEERYEKAAELMKNIGRNGEFLDELAYHKWPLFDDFRGTVEFQKTYEAIYGVPFGKIVSESAPIMEPTATDKMTVNSVKAKKKKMVKKEVSV